MVLEIPPVPDLFGQRNNEFGEGIGQTDKVRGTFRGTQSGLGKTDEVGDEDTIVFGSEFAGVPLIFVSSIDGVQSVGVKTGTSASTGFTAIAGNSNTDFTWQAYLAGDTV